MYFIASEKKIILIPEESWLGYKSIIRDTTDEEWKSVSLWDVGEGDKKRRRRWREK